ncbi:C-type mannose receptor 2-like [Fundulus heteroclitus]|uniref:C-type mannose receptor 2-like n=1 Tax=Fundulus heteroclitus TaxID=8078 RepID=UPI00165CE02E|nr:C-type mannose receptor 2-like [Fundulus heteroclitus]
MHLFGTGGNKKLRIRHEKLFCICVAVLCAVSSLPERQYYFVNELKTWTEAQSFCREKYTDLVTISSMEDVTKLSNVVDLNTMVYTDDFSKHRAWIGLFDDVNSWRWTTSDTNIYKDGEAQFTNWEDGEPSNYQSKQNCGMMLENGFWNDKDCEKYYKAVCYDAQGQDASFIFINQKMKWAEALSYCREHHTDLASVRNTTENEEIKALIQAGGEPQAWIGLNRSTWTWVDGSIFSFQHWKSGEPSGATENCVAAVMDDGGKWEDWDCNWKMPFFCYDVPVSKQVVKVKLVKTSSLDLSDPAVAEALLKQLEQKLKDSGVDGEVKLSWRSQPDGQIFHKDQ